MKHLFILITACVISLEAQDVPATTVPLQQRNLVNIPTAGMLARGQYEAGMRLFENGGLLANISVGISDRFLIGVSYGGVKFIGSGSVDLHPLPGVDARYRAIDESMVGPAVTVGFNNQGFGPYIKRSPVDSTKINRYTQKSRGLFITASKNYSAMGNLGLHGGMSWAVTEKDDKDNQPAIFVGIDKSINNELTMVWEYDLALNDNKKIIGNGRGYMNVGAKFNFDNKVLIEFIMTDILNNTKSFANFSRELRLSIVNSF